MSGPASPTRSLEDLDKKVDIVHDETPDLETQAQTPGAGSSGSNGRDVALEILNESSERVIVTAEQDRAVLRKIDLWLMPVIFMVYFLQQLDKCVFFRNRIQYAV